MSSHKKRSKTHKSARTSERKRTPRTMTIDQTQQSQLPALIPESFNLNALRNINIVGKIDEMRGLTKELSVMARQLEQWMGLAYTVGMAFKDNGVLRDVIKAVANVGTGPTSGEAPGGNKLSQGTRSKGTRSNETRRPVPPPFPFPFFQNNNQDIEEEEEEVQENSGYGPSNEPINFMEILTNPAFQEIVSKLFLQKK